MKTITLFAALALGTAMTQQAVACDSGPPRRQHECHCGGLRQRRLPPRRAIERSTGGHNGADRAAGCRRAARDRGGVRVALH